MREREMRRILLLPTAGEGAPRVSEGRMRGQFTCVPPREAVAKRGGGTAEGGGRGARIDDCLMKAKSLKLGAPSGSLRSPPPPQAGEDGAVVR